MRLRGITLAQFELAVDRVNRMTNAEGVSYGGNLHVHHDAHETGSRVITTVGRLDVLSSRDPGARRSWNGRRTKAACWHAFRDVIAELFVINPDAVVTTSMARYTSDNWEETYPPTGNVNVGSMVAPAYMPELCDCEH